MVDARRETWDLVQRCKKLHPSDEAKCRQTIADELSRLRTSNQKSDTKRYYNIRKTLDFGELVGFLVVERKLLHINDIKGLWGTALKSWAGWFNIHITQLQDDYADAYIFLLRLASKL